MAVIRLVEQKAATRNGARNRFSLSILAAAGYFSPVSQHDMQHRIRECHLDGERLKFYSQRTHAIAPGTIVDYSERSWNAESLSERMLG